MLSAKLRFWAGEEICISPFRVPQLKPIYSEVQLHSNPSALLATVQVPPFLQGSSKHGSSVKKSKLGLKQSSLIEIKTTGESEKGSDTILLEWENIIQTLCVDYILPISIFATNANIEKWNTTYLGEHWGGGRALNRRGRLFISAIYRKEQGT